MFGNGGPNQQQRTTTATKTRRDDGAATAASATAKPDEKQPHSRDLRINSCLCIRVWIYNIHIDIYKDVHATWALPGLGKLRERMDAQICTITKAYTLAHLQLNGKKLNARKYGRQMRVQAKYCGTTPAEQNP